MLPIGDSAAQQSPLTFCGFGSHVRNLQRTTGLLEFALRHGLLAPAQLHPISAYQVNVSLNWVFSRFMQPWAAPGDVNQLQNIFLGVLNELGGALAQRFFRDHLIWGDYRMIINVSPPPASFTIVARLGPAGVRWIADYLAYSRCCAHIWRLCRRQQCHAHSGLAALRRTGLAAARAPGQWQAMGDVRLLSAIDSDLQPAYTQSTTVQR